MLLWWFMSRKKGKTGRATSRKGPKTFRVTPEEKQQLLAAVEEAERGGSLPFNEGMVEVRSKSDEMLARDEAAPNPCK